ncbi:MAG: ADP-heptose:LPS heptosyltransferase [Pseudonocardiales bacterium]|nr:ADP-heptose:LPS heptosyltransferase [Pseudonocardiales bacterium]
MSERPIALVLRALGLGDFLTGLPALALLRTALPEHRIVLAAPEQLAPLARLAGTVDDLVHGHELEPLRDPPPRPELAIDLHGNGPQSRRLLQSCAPGRLVAYGEGMVCWRRDEHEVARWCRLVAEALPIPGARYPSVVGALPAPPGADLFVGVTVLHSGAKAPARRWPAERFAALAILLRERGHDVVVTGGPGEQALARRIAAAARVRALARLDLLDLLRLVAGARLIVCGDTGIAHVATNYATPSVVLFGPVSPQCWGPPPDSRHQVLWHGAGDGDPHADAPDPALLAITVAEAAAAADRALAADRRERARGA